METEKFNFAARRAEWPLMGKVMGLFEQDPMIALLKSYAGTSRRGPMITLYKEGQPVLRGSVGFGLYLDTMRFDALHILLHYLEGTGKSVEWDAISFAGHRDVIARNSGKALLIPQTSYIAHYAQVGLRQSFVEISALPTPKQKWDQIYNAFLGNTATVNIVQPDSKLSAEQLMEKAATLALAPAPES